MSHFPVLSVAFSLLSFIASCGARGAAGPSSRCASGEHPPPTMSLRRVLPTASAGGAHAWFEVTVSHVEPLATDHRLLLDGRPITIARTRSLEAREQALDATGGVLTPQQTHVRRDATSEEAGHVVGFRVAAGTQPGPHSLVFETCGVAAEAVTIEVLPSPAPTITSVRVVKGQVWPALLVSGSGLASVDAVVLVDTDHAVTVVSNVTAIDDTQLRVPMDAPGTYDVYLRSPSGLGGGPPEGSVLVR